MSTARGKRSAKSSVIDGLVGRDRDLWRAHGVPRWQLGRLGVPTCSLVVPRATAAAVASFAEQPGQ